MQCLDLVQSNEFKKQKASKVKLMNYLRKYKTFTVSSMKGRDVTHIQKILRCTVFRTNIAYF